jgi:hypothetical protein
VAAAVFVARRAGHWGGRGERTRTRKGSDGVELLV